MNPQGESTSDHVVLVAPPWALFNRPAVQLGTLKAYLQSQIPGITVVCRYFYLQIAEALGYPLYRTVSEHTWAAESLYAALLYPERRKAARRVFDREARRHAELRRIDFTAVTETLEELTEACIAQVDWRRFGIAGFSICFCQLTAALYLIRRIKQQVPELEVVAGGSTLIGREHETFFNAFPEIDAFVYGEGERPLAALIRRRIKPDTAALSSALATRETPPSAVLSFDQISDLNTLPGPDYDEYFQILNQMAPSGRFFPVLPIEASRGCWWRTRKDREQGCAFCNLNLQWAGYRTKTPARIAGEIDVLTSRHQTLAVAFADNLLPLRPGRAVFAGISELGKDLKLFGEIRATTPGAVLRQMQRAGVEEVQVGIEAMSTRLLQKLNKGTTAIQNLQVMRHCAELKIRNNANLILYFPGSDDEDVSETLRTLAWALPFQPLRCVHFWLGYGSPVYEAAEQYGIRAVFNHPHYASLFPPEIARSLKWMIQAYRGDRIEQRRRWKPVKEKVKEWKRTYEQIQHRYPGEPALSYRDGGDFMIIRELHPQGDPFTHRLTGASREIYCFCRRHRGFKKIARTFPRIQSGQLKAFLTMMCDKKLMFEERDRYLSLAVQRKAV